MNYFGLIPLFMVATIVTLIRCSEVSYDDNPVVTVLSHEDDDEDSTEIDMFATTNPVKEKESDLPDSNAKQEKKEYIDDDYYDDDYYYDDEKGADEKVAFYSDDGEYEYYYDYSEAHATTSSSNSEVATHSSTDVTTDSTGNKNVGGIQVDNDGGPQIDGSGNLIGTTDHPLTEEEQKEKERIEEREKQKKMKEAVEGFKKSMKSTSNNMKKENEEMGEGGAKMYDFGKMMDRGMENSKSTRSPNSKRKKKDSKKQATRKPTSRTTTPKRPARDYDEYIDDVSMEADSIDDVVPIDDEYEYYYVWEDPEITTSYPSLYSRIASVLG